MPAIPVSISSDVIPEMYEYERTETTVVNSYIRPVVSKYIEQPRQRALPEDERDQAAHPALRRRPLDCALGDGESGQPADVRAGGRRRRRASGSPARGLQQFLTFDMGGTSTDVALIENGTPQTRRETRVGDVTVRAPSIDVRTVGAGGGSIAYVPELTSALRVGPQSAGAVPGPAAYGKGGDAPTVTDANVVLGYCPSDSKLGGDMAIDREPAEKAVAQDRRRARHGAGEGGRRHHQHRQREHVRRAAAGLGRAGLRPARFRADRLRRRRPAARQRAGEADGLLAGHRAARARRALRLRRRHDAACATRPRARSSSGSTTSPTRRCARSSPNSNPTPHKALAAEGVDVRRPGDASIRSTCATTGRAWSCRRHRRRPTSAPTGLRGVAKRFDGMHAQLFTFALDAAHELVNLRAVVLGPQKPSSAADLRRGGPDPEARRRCSARGVYVGDGWREATIYDRAQAQGRQPHRGPAIVVEMDATTLILPVITARSTSSATS